MTDPRHRLGRAAEDAVARWLVSRGWRLVGRNTRAPGGGEVDLILTDPAMVMVAVEVRARTRRRTGDAAASVGATRVARLERTLVAHAAGSRIRHAGLRVDLVTAEPEANTPRHWRLRRIPAVNDR